MEERVGICVCGAEFPIPVKRGRPPVRCDACREAYADGTLRDKLASLGIDPDLALRKRIDLHATSTPRNPMILAERGDEIEKVPEKITVEQRLDELEMLLKSRGLHISQHRDKW